MALIPLLHRPLLHRQRIDHTHPHRTPGRHPRRTNLRNHEQHRHTRVNQRIRHPHTSATLYTPPLARAHRSPYRCTIRLSMRY